MPSFQRSLQVDADAAELYRWHARPGAFERCVPPWERVRLRGPAADLRPGARQVISLGFGPFSIEWESEIESAEPGRGFVDVQLRGPFRRWRHEHAMRDEAGGGTLEDRIEYALPLLGAPATPLVRGRLERSFAYRHRLLRGDLARHAEHADRPRLDVLVSGSTGLLGSALCAFLTTGGHRVRRLVRGRPRGADEFRWDPVTGEIDPGAAEGADAVVHLAGENIAARRWTVHQKDRIRRSRVEGTRQVADAVRDAERKPRVFVSASAVGWYGDRGDEELDERSETGTDFLADVCRRWEARSSELGGVRTVQLRFGVLVSPAGGALRKMLLPFLLGGGGPIGSGKQWMSWIALDDAVAAVHHALQDATLEGPVNVVAPEPVTNRDWARALGRVLRRPAFLPMPALAARLAFGELADALLLASQRARPRALEAAGFRFAYPELEGALRHLLGRVR